MKRILIFITGVGLAVLMLFSPLLRGGEKPDRGKMECQQLTPPQATEQEQMVQSPEFEALQQLIDEGKARSDIPLKFKVNYFYTRNSFTYAPLIFEVKGADISFGKENGGNTALLKAFWTVRSLQGEVVVPYFHMPMQISLTNPELQKFQQEAWLWSVSLFVPPGEYHLYFGLRNEVDGKVTTMMEPLVVTDFSQDKLSVSDIILAEQLVRKPDATLEANAIYDGVSFGTVAYQINFDNQFKAEDQIEFVFLVFGAGVDPQTQRPSLKVDYIIKKEGTSIGQFPLQYQMTTVSQPLPLKLFKFSPGSYTFEIVITDLITQATTTKSVSFIII